MNERTLVSVHGYAGDAHQIKMLMPVYRHHGFPVCVVSPEDSKVTGLGDSSLHAGRVGYIGFLTWERQVLQMKALLALGYEWHLMNDADSFCFTPQLPEYLFEDKNVVYSNLVDDFRKPGETYYDPQGKNPPITWPSDYHDPWPKKAAQPSYVCHRSALERMIAAFDGVTDDPITPFIDWVMFLLPCRAGLISKGFRTGVSCETETETGLRLVGDKVREGATFIHAVKRQHAFDELCKAYWSTLK
jgi:hypothetical protein